MCKGYAIVINDKKIIGKGNEHSKIFTENNLKEDDFLKVNIIYDKDEKTGYRIELDKHEHDKDDTQLKHYQELGMVTKEGKIIPSYLKRIEKYCQEHEGEVFRTLCSNMQSAETGNVNFRSAETGDVDFDSAETGDVNFTSAKTGYVDFTSAKTGYVDFYSAKTDNVDFSSAEITNMFIKDLVIKGNKQITNLIKEFSKDKNYTECTLSNFVEWIKEAER